MRVGPGARPDHVEIVDRRTGHDFAVEVGAAADRGIGPHDDAFVRIGRVIEPAGRDDNDRDVVRVRDQHRDHARLAELVAAAGYAGRHGRSAVLRFELHVEAVFAKDSVLRRPHGRRDRILGDARNVHRDQRLRAAERRARERRRGQTECGPALHGVNTISAAGKPGTPPYFAVRSTTGCTSPRSSRSAKIVRCIVFSVSALSFAYFIKMAPLCAWFLLDQIAVFAKASCRRRTTSRLACAQAMVENTPVIRNAGAIASNGAPITRPSLRAALANGSTNAPASMRPLRSATIMSSGPASVNCTVSERPPFLSIQACVPYCGSPRSVFTATVLPLRSAAVRYGEPFATMRYVDG